MMVTERNMNDGDDGDDISSDANNYNDDHDRGHRHHHHEEEFNAHDALTLTFEEAWMTIMTSGLTGGGSGVGGVSVGNNSSNSKHKGKNHHTRRVGGRRRHYLDVDPQMQRVTTVAAALNEVSAAAASTNKAGGGGHYDAAPSPSQVYANAVTTLEGTLRSGGDDDDNHEGEDLVSLQDVIYTQSALLRILAVVVGYVNPTTLAATISLTSRVLRGVVAQAEGLLRSDAVISAAAADAAANNDTSSPSSLVLLDTADGLGCLSVVLCDVCACTTQYVQQVQQSSASQQHVQQLVQAVLLKTWHDASRRQQQQQYSSITAASSSIIQTTAQDSLCALVLLNNNNNNNNNDTSSSQSPSSAVQKVLTQYIHHQIDRYVKHSKRQEENRSFVNLLGLLSTNILVGLDFDDIGGKLMTIVVDLLRAGPTLVSSSSSLTAAPSSSFVDVTSHKHKKSLSLHIVTINAILSTILSLLESEYYAESNNNSNIHDDEGGNQDGGSKKMKPLQPFASRVLASLVQVQPTLTYRSGAAELDLLESGRTIYGQVMLSACQKVLMVVPPNVPSDNTQQQNQRQQHLQVGTKLLPLAIKQLLLLSRPIEDDDVDSDTAVTLAEELTQLFRVQLFALKNQNQNQDLHSSCSGECLRVLESAALTTPFETSYGPFLNPVGTLIKQMDSDHEMVGICVETLINLRCDETSFDDASIRRLIDAALGTIIEGMGVERFWKIADISTLCGPVKPQDLSTTSSTGTANHQAWIVDVMKEAGSIVTDNSVHLSFFQENLLPLARRFDTMYAKHSTPNYRTAVVHLWELFPVFCRSPSDIADTFPKLAPILVKAMNDQRYPELIVVVSNGLNLLSTGVSERVNEFEELIEGDEAESTRNEAEVVGEVATKLLPSLFKLVDTLHTEVSRSNEAANDGDVSMETTTTKTEIERDGVAVRAVSEAIAALARTAPKQQVQGLFTKVVQRMLQTSQSEDDRMVEKMCSLLSLSQSLVISECLDETSISLLYRSLKPIVRTDETPPRIQKRAYKVLAEICRRYHSFISDKSRIKEVMELLSSTTVTSQVSARVMRLKCLTLVVEGYEDAPSEVRKKITTSLVGETLLCLKDSNAKTRDGAYKLLLEMAKVHGDIADFIKVVGAALGSKTPHMRSAAVTALSRLVFEFCSEDDAVQELLPSMMKTVLLLSDDPAREVTKSMVIFVRVSVSAATPEQLEPLLPKILGGLLKYHRGKDRFRAKIKIIIKKLVKMFGYDALMPHVPPSDTRLLTHMRKLSEREARRKQTRRVERRRPARDEFDAMMDSDEEDSDDGRTLMTGMTGAMTRVSRMSRVTSKTGNQTLKRGRGEMEASVALSAKSSRSRKASVSFRIKNDTSGDALEINDLTQKTVSFADDRGGDDSDDDDVDLQFDASGKLVVPDVDDSFSTENNNDAEVDMNFSKLSRLKRNGGRGDQSVHSQRSSKTQQSRNSKKNSKAAPGSAYKSKKAGGDVKKKGQKYEPYAYVQLDGKQYSKKNRRNAVEQMGSVVHRSNKRQKR